MKEELFQQEHSIEWNVEGGGGGSFTVYQLHVLEFWEDRKMRFNKQIPFTY